MPDPTQQREEAAWHPIYAPGVHPTIIAEYERIRDERDKWLSRHARADSEAERLMFRAEAAEAEVKRLKEAGEKLADAVRALDSYAALGGAPMERTRRADAALKNWQAISEKGRDG